VTGPRGQQGPAGMEGPAGPTGPMGSMGPMGPAGPMGAIGPVGGTGATGPLGPYGPQGPTGFQGTIGNFGLTGPQGPQGPAGVVGPTGFVGPQGPQGPAGPAGPRGPTGAVGPGGSNGVAGPQGSIGDTGCQGPEGDSSHVVWSFDITSTSSISDLGNWQTLKYFFVPAGTLTSTTAIRLLGLSHSSTTTSSSSFRIRVQDSAFNNVAVQVPATTSVHKYAGYVFKDSLSNGVTVLANDLCCSTPGYGLSTTISVSRDIFVYYEVNINSASQSWTSDFLMSELIWNY